MIQSFAVIGFFVAQTGIAAAAATCAGANPAVTSVVVKNVTSNGSLNVYHLSGTVKNLGGADEPSSTLQFVDIYQYGNRLDNKGIPPLAHGQSYTFGYEWQRSAGAGQGTTTLEFRMRMLQGTNCNSDNATYRLTI